jgi:hypothetical protein
MDRVRWFQAGSCLIVWEGEDVHKALYHGTCHGWVGRAGPSKPDDEITTFRHKEISQADAIKHMDKRGWDHPPITMATSNTKRWFKDGRFIIVWKGEDEGWFHHPTRGWEERSHNDGPDRELTYGHKEISEVFALAKLKAFGASLPPGMKSSKKPAKRSSLTGRVEMTTEWYYNQDWEIRDYTKLDSNVKGYRINITSGCEETLGWMHRCWDGSRFSANEIREHCTRVNSEQEAKEGPTEPKNAFDTGRNELLSAMASTRVLLVDTSVNVADRLQKLRKREGQIGARIERFQREQVAHAF